MMKILIFLAFLITQSSANSCEHWPFGAPSLEECCNVPNIFRYTTTYECSQKCRSAQKESSECIAECYSNENHLIVDGKVNRSALFETVHLNYFYDHWNDVLNASLEICESLIENLPSVEQQLITLHSCIRKESSQNCIEFKSSQGCTKVEKFYEDCIRQTRCDTWPMRLTNSTIQGCCNSPKLVREEMREECTVECTFKVDNWKCMSKCMYEHSGFIENGNVSVEAIKKSLIANSDPNIDWMYAIDESVTSCMATLKEKFGMSTISDATGVFILEYCLTWQLSARCVDFNDVNYSTGCYGFKTYKQMCPNVLPIPIGPY